MIEVLLVQFESGYIMWGSVGALLILFLGAFPIRGPITRGEAYYPVHHVTKR